ncbi:MAG: hypothetical protein RXQ71_02190 [Caldisphaera sp.]
MDSQPRHGEFHWVPSSTSRLLIDFIVAPSDLMITEKFINFSVINNIMVQVIFHSKISSMGHDKVIREKGFDRHTASAYLIALKGLKVIKNN